MSPLRVVLLYEYLVLYTIQTYYSIYSKQHFEVVAGQFVTKLLCIMSESLIVKKKIQMLFRNISS